VPPQQQPDVLETVPRHKGLTRPSGQWHANCGTLATSVATAVNQMEPIQAILPTKAIVLSLRLHCSFFVKSRQSQLAET
jgi:hypothetical protein